MVTEGSQPIGRGVGPVLEARDVMAVLRGEPDAPSDLRAKSLQLAARLLEFDPALRGGSGYDRAVQILDSGQALRKMEDIIDAQGRNSAAYALGHLAHDIVAPHDGHVAAIDCWRIARIARLAGAPLDKGAGIDLFRKIGDPVSAGTPLYRIYSCVQTDFDFSTFMAAEDCGYTINGQPAPPIDDALKKATGA